MELSVGLPVFSAWVIILYYLVWWDNRWWPYGVPLEYRARVILATASQVSLYWHSMVSGINMINSIPKEWCEAGWMNWEDYVNDDAILHGIVIMNGGMTLIEHATSFIISVLEHLNIDGKSILYQQPGFQSSLPHWPIATLLHSVHSRKTGLSTDSQWRARFS